MTDIELEKEILRKEYEADIVEAEKILALGKDLEWLKKTKQFQNVIVNGYIGELSNFLFNELTKSISLQSRPESELREGLLAIRHLKSYIGSDGLSGDVERNVERAEDIIKKSEDALFKL